jgi:hypothetical protein
MPLLAARPKKAAMPSPNRRYMLVRSPIQEKKRV